MRVLSKNGSISPSEESSEFNNQRQETELIGVSMSAEEEEIFSWLGLNPLLLVDNPPQHENVLVRIVRPGENEEKVLEEARHQLAQNSSKRRNKWKMSGKRVQRSNSEVSTANEEETENQDKNQIPRLEKNSIEEIKALEPVNPAEETQVKEENSSINLEEVEDPRRKRRRSSASV